MRSKYDHESLSYIQHADNHQLLPSEWMYKQLRVFLPKKSSNTHALLTCEQDKHELLSLKQEVQISMQSANKA